LLLKYWAFKLIEIDRRDFHFGGHETFPLRHIWLPMAFKLYKENNNSFPNDDNMIMRELGLGKNMAKSLRHWAESTQIFHKTSGLAYLLSEIGKEIFNPEGDEYFEFQDTIWLLHYLLLTYHKKNALWFYVFNIFNGSTIYKKYFLENLENWCRTNEIKVSPKVLDRDFICFINMYDATIHNSKKPMESILVSPFRELKLIEKAEDTYRLRILTNKEISPFLFSFCLLDYMEQCGNPKFLPLSNLLVEVKSPGRIFRLSEDLLIDYLEDFQKITNDTYLYDSTSGMKQLINNRIRKINKLRYLKRAFKMNKD